MTTVKKGDFVELEYTGMLKEAKVVFDTTRVEVAKKTGIHNPKSDYGPITICVGQQHVLPGLDEEIEGKEIGKEHTIDLSPEKAFGKKDARLIQMIPANKFAKDGVRPMPGLQVNVDGAIGMIKRAGGGRVLVDFNHPLAGQDVTYTFTITRLVSDDAVKLRALLQLQFKVKDWEITIADGVAKIASKALKLPQELAEPLTKHVHELIPSIKQVALG
ncbi:peptidylprolyl isomerase [Candidatus Woesearchaeota archaeon]|nr:peptidylprolyl isomerase [Candidatus Woesearchaeota archaeon]